MAEGQKNNEIYWHLPGLCYLGLLNNVLIRTMETHPEVFREGYKIGSVYGTFPGAIWNGGRTMIGLSSKKEIETILAAYNQKGIPARFTWTNSLLMEDHCKDTYCNLIMKLADNGMNQVLVNNPVLEEYIRKTYPNFKLISSTTKRILNLEELLAEMQKDYYIVVLDYDLNRNEKVLSALEPYADRVEILVNEICQPGCRFRSEHYLEMSKHQLEFDSDVNYPCPNHSDEKRSFAECMKRPAFMSVEEVKRYADRGFRNFKIVGRGLPKQFVLDSYLYFMVKEEYQESVRQFFMKTIAK